MSKPKHERLQALADRHLAEDADLKVQLAGMSPRLSEIRKRLTAKAALHRETARLLKTKGFASMVDETENAPVEVVKSELPAGFTAVPRTPGGANTLTWSLFEGRILVADSIVSEADAIRLAQSIAQHEPEGLAAPKLRPFRVGMGNIPPGTETAVTQLVRKLTEQLLSAQAADAGLQFSGEDDGQGSITFSGTCPADWTEDELINHLRRGYEECIKRGRPLTQDEVNSLTLFEDASLDPLAKTHLYNLMKRLTAY